MKKFTACTLILALALGSIHAQNQRVMLETNFEGQIIKGSLEELISKVSQGKELRIGWRLDFDNDDTADLEHWIDAEFISVLNGHVFNQIGPIYRQVPKMELPQIEILNSNTKWTAVIGTNGKLISRYIISDLSLVENENARLKMEKRTEIREDTVATIWVVKE